MQTATIQRRIETLPASRTVGVEAERRAVCIERCMHGSEGGAGASSSEAFRAYPYETARACTDRCFVVLRRRHGSIRGRT
jgi:hypothetical protein